VRNQSPDTSFIIARLSGEFEGATLEETGVIAGMSGSPVFIDEKLVGAVAFSWNFTRGAIAGITPIEGMRRLSELPSPREAAAAPPLPLARLLTTDLPEDLLERRLERLRPPARAGNPASVQWSVAGFGEGAREMLAGALGTVVPSGGGAASSSANDSGGELVPGDAVAAVLIDGDLRLAATGTVTDRLGDSILAFGHPFLGLGPIRIPMASAEIVTVVSNQSSSFKLANLGRRVGAFEQDRLLGIEGRLGAEAPMIPLAVTIGAVGEGGGDDVYRMEVASLPLLTPTLLAVASIGALDVSRYTSGSIGLDLKARLVTREHGELHLDQSFDGGSALVQAVTYLLSAAGYLLQNDLEKVEITEAEIELRHADRPRTVKLVGASAERSVVEPGQRVTLHLDLVPYRGAPYRHSVQVQVPEDAPDGPYYFFAGDGASIDATRLTIEPREPIRLSQALRLLRSYHPRRQLGVLGVFAGRGLAVAGEVLPQLPGSVASIWSAAASGSATPLRLVVSEEQFETLGQPLEGLVRIDVEVRRKEPLGAAEPSPGEATPAVSTPPAAESKRQEESP
jgi:hypothetical protein